MPFFECGYHTVSEKRVKWHAFFHIFYGSTSIVGVEKKEIVSSGAGSTLGTAFMCGKTGYVF